MLVTGIYKYIKTKKIKKLLLGVCVLSLPFLHIAMIGNQQKLYEQSVVGEYAIEGDTLTVLRIYEDGFFEIEKLQDLATSGKGTWSIYQWDIVELSLQMPGWEGKQLRFEVDKRGDKATLTYDPWSNIKLMLKEK